MADIALICYLTKMCKLYISDPNNFSIKNEIKESLMVQKKDKELNKYQLDVTKAIILIFSFILVCFSIAGYWYMIRCKNTMNTATLIIVALLIFTWLPGVSMIIGLVYWITLYSNKIEGKDMC